MITYEYNILIINLLKFTIYVVYKLLILILIEKKYFSQYKNNKR